MHLAERENQKGRERERYTEIQKVEKQRERERERESRVWCGGGCIAEVVTTCVTASGSHCKTDPGLKGGKL